MSCGSARGSSATASTSLPAGAAQRAAVDVPVRAGGPSPKVSTRATRRRRAPSPPGRRRSRPRGRRRRPGPTGWPWPPRRPRGRGARRGGPARSSATRPTVGRNRRSGASRNDDASTTNTSGPGSSIAATSGTSVLPASTATIPEAWSIAVTSVVTVVLPSVPVTARHGPVVPGCREVELAARRDAGRGGERERPGGARARRGSGARARHRRIDGGAAGRRRAPRRAPGRARPRTGRGLGRRAVVDHARPSTPRATQRAGDGPPGDPEAEHQRRAVERQRGQRTGHGRHVGRCTKSA